MTKLWERKGSKLCDKHLYYVFKFSMQGELWHQQGHSHSNIYLQRSWDYLRLLVLLNMNNNASVV